MVLSFTIVALTFYNVRSADFITTTGSAKKEVVSDKVKWVSTISRQIKLSTVKDGYAKLDNDLKEVRSFLTSNGIPEADIDVSPVFMNEIYDNNYQPEKNYNLVQNIEVQSADVEKIDNLAKNTSALIGKGIIFSTSGLEFYYSKLPEVRIELLDSAIADAKARADKLAKAGDKKLGSLKSASIGVVQVLSPNSAQVSDYGTYDTSKIEKEIMVTVKASFQLK